MLQDNGFASKKSYNYKPNTWTSNQSDVTHQELFRRATYNLSELVSYIKVRMFFENADGKTSVNVRPVGYFFLFC